MSASAGVVAIASVAEDRPDNVHSWEVAREARRSREAQRREAERILRDLNSELRFEFLLERFLDLTRLDLRSMVFAGGDQLVPLLVVG